MIGVEWTTGLVAVVVAGVGCALLAVGFFAGIAYGVREEIANEAAREARRARRADRLGSRDDERPRGEHGLTAGGDAVEFKGGVVLPRGSHSLTAGRVWDDDERGGGA